VLGFFLLNGYHNRGLRFPPVSEEFVKRLISKKRELPNIKIIVITDDINTSYGSHRLLEFEELKRNGIDVVITNVNELRDSTPLYSGMWRIFFQWFGQSGKGWLPNKLADNVPQITIRLHMNL
jgi:hypothetical protein